MQQKIEFKDLNRAGRAAVLEARDAVLDRFVDWGFEGGATPFGPVGDEHSARLMQALVDYLVAKNQPERATQ